MKIRLLIALLLAGAIVHFIVQPQSSTAQTGTGSGIPDTGGGECPTYQWHKYGTILDSSVITECGSCTVPQITAYTQVCPGIYRAVYGSSISVTYSYNRVMCKNCSLCEKMGGKDCNALDLCDEAEGYSCTETLASGGIINCPEYIVGPNVKTPSPPATILLGTDLAPCESTGTEF